MGDSQGKERDLQGILLTMNNAAPLNVNAELRLALPRRPFYGPVKGKRKFGPRQFTAGGDPSCASAAVGSSGAEGWGSPQLFQRTQWRWMGMSRVCGTAPGCWREHRRDMGCREPGLLLEVPQSVFPSPATSPPSPIVHSPFSSPKDQPKEQLGQPNQDIPGAKWERFQHWDQGRARGFKGRGHRYCC